MNRVSIRLRLTLWFSGVLLAGLAVFAVATFLALDHRLMEGVDSDLRARIAGLQTTLDIEGDLSREQMVIEVTEFASEIPEGKLMQLRDAAGAEMLPASKGFRLSAEGFTTELRDGHTYRVLGAPIASHGKSYMATAASDMERVNGILHDLRIFLLLAIPVVMLVAAAGGFWISRRALAPVDEITLVARSISVRNLSQRLRVPQTGDELQRMSETWNDVLERLEEAVKRIHQFTADASHELRSPVALIRATAELALRRERTSQEYQQWLRQIEDEAMRMTELTEALLALARADANGMLELEPVDVTAAATAAIAEVQPSAAEKGIRLQAHFTTQPLVAPGNAPGLRRLLLILLDNAIKYTPAGGHVTLSVEAIAAGIRVEVADTGEGIPEAALPHIFERFYRADTVRARGSGTGLGLSIARTISRAHSTEIAVESEAGKGSRFSFVLCHH
ncbi:MAG: ATP-binding protein [Bryobacteraceae bacterium]